MIGGMSRLRHLVTILEPSCLAPQLYFEMLYTKVDARDFYLQQASYFCRKWPFPPKEKKDAVAAAAMDLINDKVE
jgi:hypothetical protein